MRSAAVPKLAVFDVDGTLVTFDGQCSEATRAMLVELRDSGVVTALATGRPLASLAETLEITGPVDYAVCGNGGVLLDVADGRLLRRSVVPADLVTSTVAAVRAALPGVGVALDVGDQVIEEPGFDKRLPPRLPVPSVTDALAAAGSPLPDVQRAIFFHDDYDGDLPALADIVRPHLDDRATIFHGMMLPIVEVIPVGDNKAAALDELVRHLGIDASEALAFGDGSNDIDMLEWAGVGVAMASAGDALRAVADEVTSSVEDDGVALFVRRLLGEQLGSRQKGLADG